MALSSLFYDSHPLTRLFLGVAIVGLLLVGSVMTLLAISVALIVVLDGGWRNIFRSLGVLRWLIVPIILLHLSLTGGERLWPQAGLPLSLDGLKIGTILSLNLATYYMVAMLVSRLWRQDELLAFVPKIPHLGPRLIPYLLTMPAVRSVVKVILRQFKQQFELRRAWRQSGVLLASLLRHMLAISASCSHGVWLRWHAVPATLQRQWSMRADLPVILLGGGLLGLGCLT